MKQIFFITSAVVIALAGCQPVPPAATPTLPPSSTLAPGAQARTPTPDGPQPPPTVSPALSVEPTVSPTAKSVEKVAIPPVNTIHQRTQPETFDASKSLYTIANRHGTVVITADMGVTENKYGSNGLRIAYKGINIIIRIWPNKHVGLRIDTGGGYADLGTLVTISDSQVKDVKFVISSDGKRVALVVNETQQDIELPANAAMSSGEKIEVGAEVDPRQDRHADLTLARLLIADERSKADADKELAR
jgi:hypothetical protein